MQTRSRTSIRRWLPWAVGAAVLVYLAAPSRTQPPRTRPPRASSYDQVSPVLLGQKSFEDMMKEDLAGKDAVMARQKALLEERYDLTAKADPHAQDDPRQADPGRTDRQAGRRDDLRETRRR